MSILLPGSEQHAVQVQLERLTASFQNVTEDMRQRFVVDGQAMLDESIIGTSPIGSFRSNSLNKAFRRASMGPSGDFCHMTLTICSVGSIVCMQYAAQTVTNRSVTTTVNGFPQIYLPQSGISKGPSGSTGICYDVHMCKHAASVKQTCWAKAPC